MSRFEDIFKSRLDILRPKTADGKKGFVNAQNVWVIDPIYEDVDVFRSGVCWVKTGGNWGLINTEGALMIEPRFEDAREFAGEYANVKLQGKWGVIDRKGNMIIQPEFDLIRTFNDGLATAVKDNKSGFIDINNQRIIEPNYEDVHDFSEGLAAVKKEGLWGFINLDGEMVIEPQFNKVDGDFGEYATGIAYVEKEGADEDEYGYKTLLSTAIGKDGNPLGQWEEQEWDDDWSYEEDPWKMFGVRTAVGFIDPYGNWAVRPKFQAAKSFKDNVAIVRIDNKWGLIEKSGAYIVEPEFDNIRRNEDGSYRFEKDSEVAYTDNSFNIIPEPIAPKFIIPEPTIPEPATPEPANSDSIENDDDSDSWIESLLREDNDEEEAQKQDEDTQTANESDEDYKLRRGMVSTVVDKNNNVILKDDFETYGQLIFISEGMVITQKGDDFGFVNCKLGEYHEPIFDYIWRFSEGLAAARIEENRI